jgi:hypothetical protein
LYALARSFGFHGDSFRCPALSRSGRRFWGLRLRSAVHFCTLRKLEVFCGIREFVHQRKKIAMIATGSAFGGFEVLRHTD